MFKIWTTIIITVIGLKLDQFGFTMRSKDADVLAKRVDTDQTAP